LERQRMIPIIVFFLSLNLNTATIPQLDQLPGIGPALAKRIVEFREKKGGFRRIEELLAVPGISERRWQNLRKLVTVEEGK
jgi:competence protein ComEA